MELGKCPYCDNRTRKVRLVLVFKETLITNKTINVATYRSQLVKRDANISL